jgi:cytochrome c oxidase subunit 4
MPQRTISASTYVVVCVLLVLLTGLTISVSFMDLPGAWHLALGLLIAVTKAALVVLFFMHVLISPRLTWIVIIVACFWLGILLVLTLSDYFTRGMVPFAPGH